MAMTDQPYGISNTPQKTTGSALRSKPKPKAKVKVKRKPKPKPKPKPRAPSALDQQVQAATDLYAAPAEDELAGQRAVQQHQMGMIPAWFSDYQAAIADSGRRTQAAYAQALGMQQQTAETSSALDAQQRATQDAAMQQDAASRGAAVDPRIAAQGQQAAASRRQAVDTQTARTAGAGAVETAYRENSKVVAAGQKVTALQQESQRGRSLDSAALKLARDKGNYAVTTRQKLVNDEHTRRLENKAFGLDVAKAEADVANDATKTRLDAQAAADKRRLDAARLSNDAAKIKIAQQNANTSQRRADAYVANQTGAKGKVRKPTQSERKVTGTARNDIEYARRQIEALRTHKVPKCPDGFKPDKSGKCSDGSKPKLTDAKLSGAQIRNALLNGDGPLRPINNDAINAAVRVLDAGYLSAGQIAGLRRAYPGIRIQVLGYQTENGRKRYKLQRATNPG